MLTVVCTTCNAKIAVKDEALIGQIVACPKCGGMVLIEAPPSATSPDSPSDAPPVSPPVPRSPDSPGPAMPSGVPVPPELPDMSSLSDPTGVSVAIPSLPVSEQEIKVRRILLISLGVLFGLLLLTAASLLFFGGDDAETGLSQDETASTPVAPDFPGPPKHEPESDVVSPESPRTESPDPRPVEPPAPVPQESPAASAENPSEKEPTPRSPKSPKIETENTRPENIETEKPTPRSGAAVRETGRREAVGETDDDALRARLVELLQPQRETVRIEDVGPRLNAPLRALKFEQVPLRDVARTLARLTDVPMSFELESMRGAGIAVEQPVSATLEETTVWEALESILQPLDMAARVEEGQVSLVAKNPVRERRFPVDDLFGSGAAGKEQSSGPAKDSTAPFTPEELRRIIVSLVVPDAIEPNAVTSDKPESGPESAASGKSETNPSPQSEKEHAPRSVPGFSRIVAEIAEGNAPAESPREEETKATLEVDATAGEIRLTSDAATADRLLQLLEMLRIARKLPPRTYSGTISITEKSGSKDKKPEAGAPIIASPETSGWDTLRQPFTLNYFRPVPLEKAVSVLEKGTRLPYETDDSGKPAKQPEPLYVVFDHRALHRAGILAKELTATVRCDNGTLDEALDGLLTSLETVPLAFRIISKNLVEVSTADDLRSRRKMSVESHFPPKYLQCTTNADLDAAKPHANRPDGESGARPETLEEFLRLLKTTFDLKSPGEPAAPDDGAVYFDQPTATLFIRQSQPIQRQIRLWIESLETL